MADSVGKETCDEARKETSGIHQAENVGARVAEVGLPLIDTLKAIEKTAII